jgi:ankyrin repeat protein
LTERKHVAVCAGSLLLISLTILCVEPYGSDANGESVRLRNVAAQDAALANWPQSLTKDPAILFQAVSEQNVSVVNWLLEKGADPNARDENGVTPLMQASSAGDIEMAQLLIGRGAKVNAKAKCLGTVHDSGGVPVYDGTTALMRAAKGGHFALVKLLLRKGANANAQAEFCCSEAPKKKLGWTVLMHAADTGNLSMAKLLIKKGADVNAKTTFGWTALEQAAAQGNHAMVKLLAAHGARRQR